MGPIQGRGRAWAHASSLFRRAGMVPSSRMVPSCALAQKLIVFLWMSNPIVNSSHSDRVLLTWFVSQPTTAGLTSIFAQPSGGPPYLFIQPMLSVAIANVHPRHIVGVVFDPEGLL
jgi:hypothetical protein